MKNNISIAEALQFYLDNDLTEIISEQNQNHLEKKISLKNQISKSQNKEIAAENLGQETPKAEQENIAVKGSEIITEITDKKSQESFIKPHFSTNQALSTLAKKTLSNTTQTQNLNSGSAQNSEQKFQPLNEIIAQAREAANKAKTLAELRQAVENFDGCNLKKMATNTVFCDGNPDSKIMVIGEAPGNHEDLQGIPFCGDSGKVLDEMFGAINLRRKDDFYITNVIFWRPPGNRRPTDEELAICRPFVERHLQLVQPKVVILVGATSMTAVLGINDPVSQIRGQFMDYSPSFLSKKTKSFTIFHPSYLMRQPAKKRTAWRDMLALEQFLKSN